MAYNRLTWISDPAYPSLMRGWLSTLTEMAYKRLAWISDPAYPSQKRGCQTHSFWGNVYPVTQRLGPGVSIPEEKVTDSHFLRYCLHINIEFGILDIHPWGKSDWLPLPEAMFTWKLEFGTLHIHPWGKSDWLPLPEYCLHVNLSLAPGISIHEEKVTDSLFLR
jgi:hypothetical protein